MIFVNFWIAAPLTILGLAFAIWQLKKTKNSADAAATAARGTVDAMSGNLLLQLVTQLERLDRSIDHAIQDKERKLLLEYLSQWRWQASQLRNLIASSNSIEREFLSSIQASIASIADCKRNIMNKEIQLIDAAAPVQDAVAKVSSEFGRISSERTVSNGTGQQ